MASSSSSAVPPAAAPALASSSTTLAPSASTSSIAEPSHDGMSLSYGSSPPEVFDESDDECLFVRCHAPEEKPSFVWVCLGVGGGPLENDCSCYMVKPADRHWRDGTYVVEGGSWLGALSRVCEDPAPGKLSAFHDFDFSHSNASLRAGEIGSYAQAFLISHAHLDHILGLVLGCASLPGKRAVYGLKSTLENLLNIFDGKLWPKLASFKEDAPFIVYHLKPIETQVTLHLDDVMSTVPFSLSHGLASSTVPAPPTPTFFVPSNSTTPANYFGKRYSLPLNTLAPGSGPGAKAMPIRAMEASAAFLAGGGPKGTRPSFTSPFAPDQPVDTPESPEPTPPGGYSMAATSSSPADMAVPSQNHTDAASTDWTKSFDANESGGQSLSYLNSRQRGPPSPSSPTSSGSGFKKSPLSLLSSARRPKTSAASEKEAWGGGTLAEGQGANAGGKPTLLRSLSRSSVKSSGSGSASLSPLQSSQAQHHPSALQPSIGHSAAPITRSGKGGFREAAPRRLSIDRHPPTMDSTAFFLTNKQTGMDVLFFGDVEPDCISRSPRNKKVWSYAANRFARGKLNAVFLECSFPAAQPVEFLWGHLSTHHLVDELVVLARMVKGERAVMEKDRQRERSRSQERGQKTSLDGADGTTPRQTPAKQQQQQQGGPFDFGFFPDTSDGAGPTSSSMPPSDSASSEMDILSSLPQGSGLSASAGGAGSASVAAEDLRDVLKGLTVIIVHVKQALFPSYADAPEEAASTPTATDAAEGQGAEGAKEKPEKAKVLDPRTMQVRLLQELREKEAQTQMGVRFVMSKQGMRIEM